MNCLKPSAVATVDILVPCYNYGRYLEAAVRSAVQPGGPTAHVHIIDDASSDDTPAVAARLVARYPTVFYTRHTRNAGHHNTYNEGLRWARSRYLVLLSADDMLAPGSLGRAVSFLEAHPDVGMVYGRTRTFQDAPPDLSAAQDGFAATIVDGLDFIRAASRHAYNPIDSPASVVVRTSLQHEIGEYRDELPHAGDLEMWLRFAARARVAFLDIDQGLYRRHSTNMSLGYQQVRDYEQRWLAWQLFCRHHGDSIPEHAALLQCVEESLAAEIFAQSRRVFDAGESLDLSPFLRLAVQLNPALRRTEAWRKFAMKRLLGHRLTSIASRLKSRMSRRTVDGRIRVSVTS